MTKGNKLTRLFGKAMSFADDHQREILLGCTIVGIISTGITAWRNAPKAKEVLDKHKEIMASLDPEEKAARKAETIDTIKEMAPLVLPPIVLGVMAITCATGGYAKSSKKIAALSAAYNFSEKALADYTEKAKEMLGDKKAEAIKDEANIKHVREAYSSGGAEHIINTGKGNVLFFDKITGQFFRSDWEAIRAAVNTVNANYNAGYYDEDEIPYAELLAELGVSYNGEAAEAFVFERDQHTGKAEIKLRTTTTDSVVYQATRESATVIDFVDRPTISRDWRK